MKALSAETVVEGPDLVIRSVACADDHARWSVPEASLTTGIVLVRRGRFRVDAQGRQASVDATVGYLQRPGRELRFAHPAGGDVCTSVTLPGDGLGALAERLASHRSPVVRVDARLELAHRRVVRTGGADPHFAAVESVVDLLELALRDQPGDDPAPGRRELAERAREAIVDGEPDSTGLVPLARRLGTSPAHLSRTFRHHAGMPLSRYRNRLRVSRALARMEQGETGLAALAVSLGFSDQAHMARVMRAELGEPPARVRALLAGSGPGAGSASGFAGTT